LNNLQKTLNNFFSLLSSELITKIFSFLVIVYLARIIGPSAFGKVSFAMAIFMYFWVFSTLGLDILGTREIAKDKESIFQYISEIGFIKILLSIIAYVLMIIFVLFFISSKQMRLLILFYGLTLLPTAFLFEWAFQGIEKMHFISVSRLISNVLYFALILIIVKSSNQILFVPLLYFFSFIIAALFLVFSLFFLYKKLPLEFRFKRMRNIFLLAIPIGFSFILAQIFYNFDLVMLGFMKNEVEVGFYNAVFKVYMFVILFAGIYHSALFPRITHFYNKDPIKLEIIYQRSNRILAIFAVPIVIGGIVLAPKIISLIYGNIYLPGVLALQILFCGIITLYINTGYHRGLLACGREKWYLAGVLVPVLINIIMNFILIPPFGLNGAAFATVLGELTAFIVSYVGFNKVVRAPFLKYLFKPFIASCVMLLFLLWALNHQYGLFLLFTLGSMVYFVALYLVKGIALDDIEFIRQRYFQPGNINQIG
jgi:O-antigen/teichoic acid export membrane protein